MRERRLLCDVLVIGAGPAGIAASKAALEQGLSVIMVDDNLHYGGQLWRHSSHFPPPRQARHAWQALFQFPTFRVLMRCRVVMAEPQQVLCEHESGHHLIWCQKMILCCGAKEQFLPFPGWTLPGVTGAGGLQALAKGGMALKGKRVVVAGSGPLLLSVAKTVRQAGGEMVLLAEQADWQTLIRFGLSLWRWPDKLAQAIPLFSAVYRPSSWVLSARGEQRLQTVYCQIGEKVREVECEYLACAWGLLPNSELGQLLGCALRDKAIEVDAWQQTTLSGIYAAGECAGQSGGELSQITGAIAGYAASENLPAAERLWRKKNHWQQFIDTLADSFALNPKVLKLSDESTIICRCENVTLEQLQSYSSWRQAKLSSRCGMGACQGKICSAITQRVLGWDLPSVRQPCFPARLDTLVDD